MTAVIEQSALVAPLDAAHEASEPPEVRGRDRSDVRLLVSEGLQDVVHATFSDLPNALHRGDVVVVNTSATIPAAIWATLPDGEVIRVHFSTEMPGGFWLVEARRPDGITTVPRPDDLTGTDVGLLGGGHLTVLDRLPGSQRLWLASPHLGAPVIDYLDAHGEPIRYRHAPGPGRIDAYQQIFGTEPGSAEMPSAARRSPRSSCSSSRAGRHDRDDPPARRGLVARGARDAVPRALPRARRHRGPPQRGAPGGWPGGRGRDDGGPGARDRHRRPRDRAPRRRLDRARDHARARRARGRRARHGMARARGQSSADAGGDRRPAGARMCVPGAGARVTCGTSSATVTSSSRNGARGEPAACRAGAAGRAACGALRAAPPGSGERPRTSPTTWT